MGLGVLVALAALVGQPAVGPGLGLQFASIKPLERSSVVELDAPVTGQRNAIDERGGVNGGSVPELGLVDDKPQQGQDDAWRHDAFTRGNDLLWRTDGGEFGDVFLLREDASYRVLFGTVARNDHEAPFQVFDGLLWLIFGIETRQHVEPVGWRSPGVFEVQRHLQAGAILINSQFAKGDAVHTHPWSLLSNVVLPGQLNLPVEPLSLFHGVFAGFGGGLSSLSKSGIVGIGASFGVPSRKACENSCQGCCAESQHSGNRLHKGASRLLSGEGQVLFGKVIRTNRLVECGLIFAIVLSGYGAAFALGWGLFGGERLQPLWIAIGSAGPVVMLLAVICLVSGKVWVPW